MHGILLGAEERAVDTTQEGLAFMALSALRGEETRNINKEKPSNDKPGQTRGSKQERDRASAVRELCAYIQRVRACRECTGEPH